MKSAVQNIYLLRSAGVSQKAQATLQELAERHARDISQMAEEVGFDYGMDEAGFQSRAVRVMGQNPAYTAVALIDEHFLVRWAYPFRSAQQAAPRPLEERFGAAAAARKSRDTRQAAATGREELDGGAQGVYLYAPVHRGPDWYGFIEGALETTKLALTGIAPFAGTDFRFAIVDDRRGDELFSTLSETDRARTPAYDSYFTLAIADRTWWVVLRPSAAPPALALVIAALILEMAAGAAALYIGYRRWK